MLVLSFQRGGLGCGECGFEFEFESGCDGDGEGVIVIGPSDPSSSPSLCCSDGGVGGLGVGLFVVAMAPSMSVQ